MKKRLHCCLRRWKENATAAENPGINLPTAKQKQKFRKMNGQLTSPNNNIYNSRKTTTIEV